MQMTGFHTSMIPLKTGKPLVNSGILPQRHTSAHPLSSMGKKWGRGNTIDFCARTRHLCLDCALRLFTLLPSPFYLLPSTFYLLPSYGACPHFLPTNEPPTDANRPSTGLNRPSTGLNRRSTEINRRDTGLNRRDTEINSRSTETNGSSTGLNGSSTEVNRRDTGLNRRATEINSRDTDTFGLFKINYGKYKERFEPVTEDKNRAVIPMVGVA